jgi:hypothetical protein
VLNDFDEHGFIMKKWILVEHTGTHILVVPLAVVDIRAKAEKNADAQLNLEDLNV